jgi:hypothetical protein
LVRCSPGPGGEGLLKTCIICGQEFSRAYKNAMKHFFDETSSTLLVEPLDLDLAEENSHSGRNGNLHPADQLKP